MREGFSFQRQQLTVFERQEARLGRSHWTLEDYREAGRAEFDRVFTASREPYPGEREHYARTFVDINCPPSKRAVAIVDVTLTSNGVWA